MSQYRILEKHGSFQCQVFKLGEWINTNAPFASIQEATAFLDVLSNNTGTTRIHEYNTINTNGPKPLFD